MKYSLKLPEHDGSFVRKKGGWKAYHHWLRQPVTSSKIGRNEPCPCGSGKKYKKCCWKK